MPGYPGVFTAFLYSASGNEGPRGDGDLQSAWDKIHEDPWIYLVLDEQAFFHRKGQKRDPWPTHQYSPNSYIRVRCQSLDLVFAWYQSNRR